MIARKTPEEMESSTTEDTPNFSKRLRLIKEWHLHLHLFRSDAERRGTSEESSATSPLKSWERILLLPVDGEVAAALRGTISAFVKVLSDSYCIVSAVQLDSQRRALLTYEQTLIPDLDLSNSSNRWIEQQIGRIRIAMGTRPPVLTLGISNAFTCQSYHLRVGVGDDLYVSRQVPIDFGSLVNRKAPGAPTVPHMRFQRRLGQPHAHFYARYMPEPVPALDATLEDESTTSGSKEASVSPDRLDPTDQTTPVPRIRFIFIEVPPGSLIRAAVAAVSAAAIIWLIAFLNEFPTKDGLDTDAPAFLLTFPAVVAAWMGFESPSRKGIEGTLRARFVLLLTAITSIAASGLFVAHKSIDPERFSWPKLPEGYSILGVADVWWSVLIAISAANAIYICYKYYVFTLYFTIHSTREQPGSNFTQHG